MKSYTVAGLSILLALILISPAASDETGHVELGAVDWLRDYEAAVRAAKRTNKPVLILFQEVPGCATCRNYGLRVLSHPLLVEAAGDLFIPLAIFNNRGGKDAEVLEFFGEPSWNNPVVRIIDKQERELTRRLAGDYSPGGFSGALIEALKKAGKPVPPYLTAIHAEFSSEGLQEKAYLSMFCFWQGEVDLGGIKGVVATRSGFIDGREIVEITFNSEILSFSRLLKAAGKLKCADRVFPVDEEQRTTALRLFGEARVDELSHFREDRQVKYYLSRSPYRFVPMTPYQQVLVNREIYAKGDPARYLSPNQIDLYRLVRSSTDRVWKTSIGSTSFTADYAAMMEALP